MRFLLPALFALQVCCTAATLPQPKAPEAEATFMTEVTIWRLPIPVAVSNYPDPAAVAVAMEAWNQWLGTEVFKPGISSEQQVVVEASLLPGTVFAGITFEERPWHKRIRMFQPYHGRADIVAHELGHVLGLAHDKDTPWSLMDGQPSWVLPRLTRADCLALAELYFLRNPPCAKEML